MTQMWGHCYNMFVRKPSCFSWSLCLYGYDGKHTHGFLHALVEVCPGLFKESGYDLLEVSSCLQMLGDHLQDVAEPLLLHGGDGGRLHTPLQELVIELQGAASKYTCD